MIAGRGWTVYQKTELSHIITGPARKKGNQQGNFAIKPQSSENCHGEMDFLNLTP